MLNNFAPLYVKPIHFNLGFSGPLRFLFVILLRAYFFSFIVLKWTNIGEKKYSLRNITNKDLKVPEKPRLKCMGFTYNGAKLFNMLPPQMRETKDQKKRIFILLRIADLKAPNYL